MTVKMKGPVNDVMEELMDLDMEPKPWSLWTSVHEAEVEATLEVEGQGQKLGDAFCGSFRFVESRDGMDEDVKKRWTAGGGIHTFLVLTVCRRGPSVKLSSLVLQCWAEQEGDLVSECAISRSTSSLCAE